LKSIKVDEETYKLLLKLKYEHAMRGVRLTFSDMVKGLLLKKCHSSKSERRSDDVVKNDLKKMKSRKLFALFA